MKVEIMKLHDLYIYHDRLASWINAKVKTIYETKTNRQELGN